MKLKTSLFSRLMRPFLTTATFASLLVSANAGGYLKIGDIKGEATDDRHKQWIDLLSVSASMHRPTTIDPTTGQRRRGDVVLEDIVFVKELDKASPKLMEAVCTGAVIPTVEFVLTREVVPGSGQQEPYLKYELKNVLISSYSLGNHPNGPLHASPEDIVGADGSVRPAPPAASNMSLNFEEVKVTYTEYDRATGAAKGNVEYSWKVEEGQR